MTEEQPAPSSEETQEASPIEKLRNEFQEQFNTLQSSFSAELEKNKAEIERLQKENTDLNRALIRSAQLPPQ